MEPVRVESYKSFEVRIFVLQALRERSFTGLYEASQAGQIAKRGVVAGGFATAHIAEEAALEAAKTWVNGKLH